MAMAARACFIISSLVALSSCVAGHNLAVLKFDGSRNVGVRFLSLDVDGQEIIGLAQLKNRLYVVCVMNSSLFVFQDTPPYKRIAVIAITELAGIRPVDMVTNKIKMKQLYIMDRQEASEGGTRIWQVNTETFTVDSFPVTEWTGTMAIASWKDTNGYVLGVSEDQRLNFAKSANDVEHINLPTGSTNPQHATHFIELKGNIYYVTVGCKPGEPHRVLKVDKKGKMKEEYGDALPGNGTGQFNWPRYVIVTPYEDLLVADYCNRRIVELSPSLQPMKILPNATSLSLENGWPQRMMAVQTDNYSNRKFDVFVALAETAHPACQHP